MVVAVDGVEAYVLQLRVGAFESGARHLVEPFGAITQRHSLHAVGLHALAVVEGEELVVPIPSILVDPCGIAQSGQKGALERVVGGELSRVRLVVDVGAHVLGLEGDVVEFG